MDGDLAVNRSRVFALGGGDILVWSSNGNIDAGRGAKNALLAPPPRLVFDPVSGSFRLELTGEATGSGIGTLVTTANQELGDIYLIAPNGRVDAGDAGIRVSGNLVIAAREVIGADNIEVAGSALGVFEQSALNNGLLAAASNATSAVSAEAERIGERARPLPVRDIPTILTVRFVGFGNESN